MYGSLFVVAPPTPPPSRVVRAKRPREAGSRTTEIGAQGANKRFFARSAHLYAGAQAVRTLDRDTIKVAGALADHPADCRAC
jgi:hypothetical protein